MNFEEFGSHPYLKVTMSRDSDEKFLDRLIEQIKAEKDFADGDHIHFNHDDLIRLARISIKKLYNDPILLNIKPPLCVFGDIHGFYQGLMSFLDYCGYPPETNLLFLGDYVDRGPNSVDTIVTLLALKCRYPKNVWLIRGNHETRELTSVYGFMEECKSRYSLQVWDAICECFRYMPIAAIVGGTIFCVHGGITAELQRMSQISQIERPLDPVDGSLVQNLLWADPDPHITGFVKSSRGTSYKFGVDIAENFVKNFGFDLICRAHQSVEKGFEFPFSPSTCLVTLFSADGYSPDHPNQAAMMNIDEDLVCSFKFLKSKDE